MVGFADELDMGSENREVIHYRGGAGLEGWKPEASWTVLSLRLGFSAQWGCWVFGQTHVRAGDESFGGHLPVGAEQTPGTHYMRLPRIREYREKWGQDRTLNTGTLRGPAEELGPGVETKKEQPVRVGDQECVNRETKTGRLFEEGSQAVGAAASVEFISLLTSE